VFYGWALPDSPRFGRAFFFITHFYLLAVTNGRGETASDTVNVTVTGNPSQADITPPVIEVTSPASAYAIYTNSSIIELRGTASDNIGVKSLSRANPQGGSGTALGATDWSIDNLPVAIGYHVIYLNVEDAAGNLAKRMFMTIRLNK
jgi:hypothetical protein